MAQPPDATAGFCRQSGFDEIDGPVLAAAFVHKNFTGADVDREVAVQRVVLGEVFLDLVTAKSQCNDEIIVAVMGIVLEDVPQDRAAADFDHGLGLGLGFLSQPCPGAAGENYRPHSKCPPPVRPEGAVLLGIPRSMIKASPPV